jgi:Spy/CpxP family protein refolding chaperone
MRTLCKWALVLAVPAVWVAPARPGEEPQVAGATTMRLLLLRQKSVQEELKLTPEVTKKILEFTNKEYAEFQKAQKLSKQKRLNRIEELEQKNKKFLKDNLTEAQRKRLDQIRLQVTGLYQLTRPEVAKALNLTEAQRTKFREMHKEARKKFTEILEEKDREGRNKKLAKLRKEVYKAIGAVLTDKQKAKVKEAVGEPFTGELLFEEADGPTSLSSPAWRASPSVRAARSPLRGPGRLAG